MDEIDAICVLREPKQNAFDAVCRDFVLNHNIEKIAKRIGLSGTVLRSKLNPEQQYKLTPVDMALISKETGDYTIINTVLADLGVVVAKVPSEEESKTFIERILDNSILSGELSSDALKMCNADRLYRSDKRKTIAKAQAAIGNLVLLMSDLENRTSGTTPLISMGFEFIANGAPIPRLKLEEFCMSVATVEHSTAVPPLENPCPDLSCWSLNREQKERGLTLLQRTRKEIGERQLKPLRSRRAELQAQFSKSDCRAEQMRLSREINRIDANAQDVLSRWS